VVGIFGSGNEARRNLEAICLVRKIERVKVYSPSREHRESFAAEMTEALDVEIQAVTSAEAVIKGSDIVMCATNSSEPVFDGNWLEPGQFVTTIANTDGVHRRTEADPATMIRSDLIVLNSRETAVNNQQRELLDLIDEGKVQWDKICELGDVLIGKHPGRASERQIIYYKSNTGVGIQFAATGALIYEACKKQGLGKELPSEWFGADLSEWMDKGFMPSP
jgi:ornithine cyclodeaminase